ncbi:unnamed protein product [Effrenium voratum]|nr:unnamed protein product [Effrenium voratum]
MADWSGVGQAPESGQQATAPGSRSPEAAAAEAQDEGKEVREKAKDEVRGTKDEATDQANLDSGTKDGLKDGAKGSAGKDAKNETAVQELKAEAAAHGAKEVPAEGPEARERLQMTRRAASARSRARDQSWGKCCRDLEGTTYARDLETRQKSLKNALDVYIGLCIGALAHASQLRWMTDAEEGSDAPDAEPPKSEADKPAPASASSSTPGTAGYGAKELTDEERLQRVLQRCDAEGLERSEAQEALAAEQAGLEPKPPWQPEPKRSKAKRMEHWIGLPEAFAITRVDGRRSNSQKQKPPRLRESFLVGRQQYQVSFLVVLFGCFA